MFAVRPAPAVSLLSARSSARFPASDRPVMIDCWDLFELK